jgi:N-acetylglucosamine-6-phosphate deacetylase
VADSPRRANAFDPLWIDEAETMRLGVEAALVEGTLVQGDLEIADGRIARAGLSSANGRGIAVPGFVDLQVNGFAGIDFLAADHEGYRRAGEALLETGVTAYLPTFITATEDRLLAALRGVPTGADGPRILGVHLEGPFISPRRLGIHPGTERKDPDVALLERLLAAGPVRLVTLAPELPGAGDLIDCLLSHEIAISCGHSDATSEEANRAFDAGVRTVTHIFNAMRPFSHRDPGIAGAALARDDVVVQLILDGVHLAPEAASVVWQAAAGRVALVTDAVAGAGLVDGSYRLSDFAIEIRDGVARGAAGELAGSTLTMIEAVRSLHALGASLEESVEAATAVPAQVLRQPAAGRIAPGLPADVLVLTEELEIERVLLGGTDRVAL